VARTGEGSRRIMQIPAHLVGISPESGDMATRIVIDRETFSNIELDGLQTMRRKSPISNFIVIVGIAVVVTVGFAWWLRQGTGSSVTGGLSPGNPVPEIKAAGWLNGEPPSASKLKGRVVLINSWFVACPYCHKEAPGLVQLYRRYQDRVVFIGLTPDPEQALPSVRAFLEDNGMTWPTGYGADDTLLALKGEYFPGAWLIDTEGTIVWNHGSSLPLEKAIEQVLAK